MSAFVPSKGQHFYATLKPIVSDLLGANGVVTKARFEDRSFRGDVLRCIGRDDHAIAAVRTRAQWPLDGLLMFVRSETVFEPVGPEILAALGLSEVDETTAEGQQ